MIRADITSKHLYNLGNSNDRYLYKLYTTSVDSVFNTTFFLFLLSLIRTTQTIPKICLTAAGYCNPLAVFIIQLTYFLSSKCLKAIWYTMYNCRLHRDERLPIMLSILKRILKRILCPIWAFLLNMPCVHATAFFAF